MLEAIRALLNAWAVSFDLPILEWIQANLRNPVMDEVWKIITLFGDAGIFWILCGVILLVLPKTRKTGLAVLIALVLGVVVCNVTLKPLIGRIRPYDFQMQNYGKEITLLVSAQHDFSFPSGHTIASFEACVAMLLNDKRLGIPATVLAFLVAFSRLYLYVHYPSDVIFSFFAGILFAFIGNAISGAVMRRMPVKGGRYLR